MAKKKDIVEVEVDENYFDINALKSRATELGNKDSALTASVAEKIKVGNLDANESMLAFKELFLQTRNLKPSGVQYKMLNLARKIPLIGSRMEEVHDTAIKEFMNSDTINSIIDKMFDGIKEKSDELKNRVLSFIDMKEELKLSMDETIMFKEEIEAILAKQDRSDEGKTRDVYQLEDLLGMVLKRITNYSDTLNNLVNAQISIDGLAKKMDENIPATKEELKMKFVIASSLDESNKVMELFLEVTDITEELNYSVNHSIMDSMHNSLELDRKHIDMSKREKRELEFKKRQKEFLLEREKIRKETTFMIEKQSGKVDQMVIEYKETKGEK